MTPTTAEMVMKMISEAMTAVPPLEPVAWKKISMNGYPLVDWRASSILVAAKSMEITIARPMRPLMKILPMMDRGTATEGLARKQQASLDGKSYVKRTVDTCTIKISNHVHTPQKAHNKEHTGKGKNESQETDKEGKTLRGPPTLVAKRGKDGRRIALRAKRQEGNEHAKEADNVQHENHALNLGQQRADDGVDEDGDEHHGPDNQRALPRLPVVLGPGEADEALHHAAGQEPVDETAGTAVGKARREAHEHALPGDEDGAAKAENGQEAKVALPIHSVHNLP
ncbi:hypothetical protein BM221_002659 [Beauveria bassiana]|uniref:Uncharacterized protein n=1 Tax=Beauveria bassiana TaxID=176275 RepID=A0A2N6NZ62_BEABA|nr:hypothetical protein BM221_002659 [Beauveria bassiana]